MLTIPNFRNGITGQLGGMRFLIPEKRDRQSDDDPSHHLFFTEAPDRRQGAEERGDGQRALAAFREASGAIRGAPQELPGAGAARPRRCTGVGAMSARKSKARHTPVAEKPISLSSTQQDPTKLQRLVGYPWWCGAMAGSNTNSTQPAGK